MLIDVDSIKSWYPPCVSINFYVAHLVSALLGRCTLALASLDMAGAKSQVIHDHPWPDDTGWLVGSRQFFMKQPAMSTDLRILNLASSKLEEF